MRQSRFPRFISAHLPSQLHHFSRAVSFCICLCSFQNQSSSPFYIRSCLISKPYSFTLLASALMPIPLHLFAKSFRSYGATSKSENRNPGKIPRPSKPKILKVQLLNAVSRSMASEVGDGRNRWRKRMIVGRATTTTTTTTTANGRRAEWERWKVKRRGGNESGECGGLRFRECVWIRYRRPPGLTGSA